MAPGHLEPVSEREKESEWSLDKSKIQKRIPTKNDIDSAGRPVIKILSSVYIAGVTQHRKHICKHDWEKQVKNFRKFTG